MKGVSVLFSGLKNAISYCIYCLYTDFQSRVSFFWHNFYLKNQQSVPIIFITQPPRLVPSGNAKPWRLFYGRI